MTFIATLWPTDRGWDIACHPFYYGLSLLNSELILESCFVFILPAHI